AGPPRRLPPGAEHTPPAPPAPPTCARERPFAPTDRRSTKAPPSSNSPPASVARSATSDVDGTRTRPSTLAESAPERTCAESARPPKSSNSPVTTMVLPAPVSPVTTVSPAPSGNVASRMTPRPGMCSLSSTGWRLVVAAGVCPVSATETASRQLELGDEPLAEAPVVDAGDSHRLRAASHPYPATRRDVDGAAPVTGEHAGMVVAEQLDVYHRLGRHHDRAGEQRVRGVRNHEQRVDVR